MKYIRTTDGRIVNRLSEFTCFKSHGTTGRYIVRTLEDDNDLELWLKYNRTSVIKQADTIEELCDEFVLIDEENEHYIKQDNDIHHIRRKMAIGNYHCFGAIWTDKGLIYVAKMKGVLPNGKIDWELE